jgi:hypothetical protein
MDRSRVIFVFNFVALFPRTASDRGGLAEYSPIAVWRGFFRMATRSFKGLILLLGILCSLSLALAAPVAAQTPSENDLDIEGIGETVLDTDPDVLLADLEDPMRNRDLPDGFSNAEYIDPNDAEANTGLIGGDSLEDTLGSVAYTVEGDPDELGGTKVIASIQYVVLDQDIEAADTLDDFIGGVEDGLEGADPDEGAGAIDTVTVGDVDAALISFTQETDKVSVVVKYLAVPVGNVYVFAAVTIADSEPVDEDDVQGYAESLALSAISYLGDVAEDAA